MSANSSLHNIINWIYNQFSNIYKVYNNPKYSCLRNNANKGLRFQTSVKSQIRNTPYRESKSKILQTEKKGDILLSRGRNQVNVFNVYTNFRFAGSAVSRYNQLAYIIMTGI